MRVALGADAVLIGRMSVYGLALGGEAGVTRTLQLLHQELEHADAAAARRRVHPRPQPKLHRRHLAGSGGAHPEHTLSVAAAAASCLYGSDSLTSGLPDGPLAVHQTGLMASFADVERVEPDLADRVRAILSSTTNAVLGTIRRDGSPRLSGADPYFHDGQLRIWSMPRARKGQDLRRDPRVAVHSIPWDSRRLRDGAADVGAADAKVSGTAVLATDAGDLTAFRPR